MNRAVVYAMAAAMLVQPALAREKEKPVYGPLPDWGRFIELGEVAVRKELRDPDNWTIEWPNAYADGGWRKKGQHIGYTTCGIVRPKNPVIGKDVPLNFIVVIDQDRVKAVDIATYRGSPVNVFCPEWVRRGMLKPASTMSAPKVLDLPLAIGATIRVMPEGAYVIATTQVTAAARAGLKPGMVITRVNGIALAGLGQAMGKLLDSDTPTLTLETAAGERLELRRNP